MIRLTVEVKTEEKLKRTGFYPLVDRLPLRDRTAILDQVGFTIPDEELNNRTDSLRGCDVRSIKENGYISRHVFAKWTGEKRPPKKGEWYLSGAIIGAYQAGHDLSNDYHIATLVHVEHQAVVVANVLDLAKPCTTPYSLPTECKLTHSIFIGE